jgi:hypothetical protein
MPYEYTRAAFSAKQKVGGGRVGRWRQVHGLPTHPSPDQDVIAVVSVRSALPGIPWPVRVRRYGYDQGPPPFSLLPRILTRLVVFCLCRRQLRLILPLTRCRPGGGQVLTRLRRLYVRSWPPSQRRRSEMPPSAAGTEFRWSNSPECRHRRWRYRRIGLTGGPPVLRLDTTEPPKRSARRRGARGAGVSRICDTAVRRHRMGREREGNRHDRCFPNHFCSACRSTTL